MTQIYWSYEPRKYIDSTSLIDIDDSELDIVCKQLLEGTKSHLSSLLPCVWEWFDFPIGEFDQLNLLNEKTFNKIDDGQPIAIFENPTYSQAMLTLGDFLALSLLWEKLAQDALCENQLSDFISRHTLSVSIYSTFTANQSFLSASAEDTGNEYEVLMRAAVAANCTKASHKAVEFSRKMKAKALDLYRNGNFKSKNQAAEKIAPAVNRTVAVVRGWLQGI